MTTSIVNDGAFSNVGGDTYTLPWLPTVGNWLIVASGSNDSSAPAAGSGWSRYIYTNDGSSYLSTGVYYRQVQPGDTSLITPTSGSIPAAPASILEVAGLPNGLPTDFRANGQGLTFSTFTPPSGADMMLIVIGFQRNTSSVLVVGGTTYDVNANSGRFNSRDAVLGVATAASSAVTPTFTYDPGGDQKQAMVLQLDVSGGGGGGNNATIISTLTGFGQYLVTKGASLGRRVYWTS